MALKNASYQRSSLSSLICFSYLSWSSSESVDRRTSSGNADLFLLLTLPELTSQEEPQAVSNSVSGQLDWTHKNIPKITISRAKLDLA